MRWPGLIITRMVININESLLRTIAQLLEFLDATPQVQFSCHGDMGITSATGTSAPLQRLRVVLEVRPSL